MISEKGCMYDKVVLIKKKNIYALKKHRTWLWYVAGPASTPGSAGGANSLEKGVMLESFCISVFIVPLLGMSCIIGQCEL